MRFLTSAILASFFSVACLAQAPTVGGCSIFPADNIWNTPIDTLPVHPNSANYISRMGPTMPLRMDFGPGIYQGGLFGMPVVTVSGSATKYPATFRYWQESDPGPYANPLNSPIEGGATSTGDRHTIAVDTTNCVLYELFDAHPLTSSWQAGGGAIFNLKSNALRPAGWTSADAAGLSIYAGLARYDEIAAGEIRHALRVVASATQKAYLWPARHYASSITDTSYPPMGLRLRLKASVDTSNYPREAQIILRALKKYGLFLADNGTSWFVGGQPDDRWNTTNLRTMMNITGNMFEAVDESSLMVDPNSGQARQIGVSVAVAPASVNIITQGSQQFTATVQGSTNQSVTWKVNGIAGGNSQVGYIDAAGRYSAPGSVPSPATVQVSATSAASSSAIGNASVTIRYPAPVILGLTPTTMTTGAVNLTVSGNYFQTGAVVKLNGAALTTTFVSSSQLKATGSTTAVGTAIPVSISNPDSQVSNTANVSVTSPVVTQPVAITMTPSLLWLVLGQTAQYTANVANTADKRVIWAINGLPGGNAAVGTISTTGLYTAPAAISTTSLLVRITATSVADSTKTAYAYAIVRK